MADFPQEPLEDDGGPIKSFLEHLEDFRVADVACPLFGVEAVAVPVGDGGGACVGAVTGGSAPSNAALRAVVEVVTKEAFCPQPSTTSPNVANAARLRNCRRVVKPRLSWPLSDGVRPHSTGAPAFGGVPSGDPGSGSPAGYRISSFMPPAFVASGSDMSPCSTGSSGKGLPHPSGVQTILPPVTVLSREVHCVSIRPPVARHPGFI